MKPEPFLLSVKLELANCGPWAESSLQPVFVNKVLLEHSYTPFIYILSDSPFALQ